MMNQFELLLAAGKNTERLLLPGRLLYLTHTFIYS